MEDAIAIGNALTLRRLLNEVNAGPEMLAVYWDSFVLAWVGREVYIDLHRARVCSTTGFDTIAC